jgi:hypothetical protein
LKIKFQLNSVPMRDRPAALVAGLLTAPTTGPKVTHARSAGHDSEIEARPTPRRFVEPGMARISWGIGPLGLIEKQGL